MSDPLESDPRLLVALADESLDELRAEIMRNNPAVS